MKKLAYLLATMAALCLLILTTTAVSALSYTVQPGDTLYSIARRFGTTVNALVIANHLPNPNLIYVGQQLDIPDGSPPPNPTPPPPPTPPDPTLYIVRPGDTLSAIARQFNTTVAALVAANNIINPHYIYAGQQLIVPGDAPPSPPLPPVEFALGGQSLNMGNHIRFVEAGMSWIKVQYKWAPGHSPEAVAGLIANAHDHGFKILLSISGAQAYPPANSIDFDAYVAFVGQVAALSPDAIEIWNEQNIDYEWPAGQISPVSYVNNMLAPAYQAIKAANANVLVVSGAPAPTGFDNELNAWADDRYLHGMAAAGAANYLDCVGVHYNAGATSPHATSGHPADDGRGHYSWYFTPMLNLYDQSFNRSRPLCFTELGYLSAEDFPFIPPAFSWASQTAVSQHAQWLGEAVSLARQHPRVQLLIVFNVDFSTYTNHDPQAGYAIIRPDGRCPACSTLKAAMP